MMTLRESGLIFEFEESNCYCIEDDPLVHKTSNIMACECVSIIGGRHYFIEAKKSAPQGPNGDTKKVTLEGNPLPSNWKVIDNYRNYLREISKKFIDSFSLLKAIMEKRHGEERQKGIHLPEKTLDLSKLRFVLVLNLPENPGISIDKQRMVTLQDALKNEMRPFLSIWNIPDTSVKVVLPSDAKQKLHIPIRDAEDTTESLVHLPK